MEHKNIVATIYIKNGQAVGDPKKEPASEGASVLELAKMYNDSGVDKIICFDLSDDEEEHEKNLLAIREINRNIDIKTCGGGNIRRIDDVKRLLYAGCVEVVLNGAKPETIDLLKEASSRFGAEKILVSLTNVDFIFKTKSFLSDNVHELLLMQPDLVPGIENVTDIPYILVQDTYDLDRITELLRSSMIRGIYGDFINRESADIMQLKATLSERGIIMDNFEPKLSWSDLKVNSDGLVPVVVQDYQTNQVLMVAYMNEEAFDTTIRIGKMTYWSRSRQELWIKGLTSGHIQYVKSLTADCDFDTILAKVSQVGGIACHTGAPSCFFNEIIKKEYIERSPLKIFENTYADITKEKQEDRESYVKQLMDKGLDGILRKIGEESAEMIIASKNADERELIHESADLLYHLMILMVEKNVSWEEVTRELAQR